MRTTSIFLFALLLAACGGNHENEHHGHGEGEGYDHSTGATKKSEMHYAEETHLKNVRQLTYGGDNAEAYWSYDDTRLVFQAKNERWGTSCDQIYIMPVEGKKDSLPLQMISTGKGRTTCSYFMPGDTTILYASTHLLHDSCPPVPERKHGDPYVWPVYAEFDIFVSDLEGNIISQLTNEPGYDAEATLSPKGDKIVFTSTRSGDLELYVMDIDGSNVVQITDELGYDGGAFFSPDGSKIVWRASRPTKPEDVELYQSLLAKNLVQPTEMELFVCNVDGSDKHQVTHLGGANWAPFFHPSGEKLVFSTNHHTGEAGFPFNLFMINLDGTGLEQITYDGVFDAFPMFSYSGKYLVWGSNRNNGRTHDTNLFLAEWAD
ncbi:MAG: PD40 domain-containing protein [Flavobacteriales bacterium]|nr:PD40 domain-containing protein [Flavobacteriales bacterium]